METVYFQGTPCHTYGTMPRTGEKAPCFTLVSSDLREIRCTDYQGTRVVLNIFPSLDTPVCATSVRRFNKEATELPDVKIINVSMDLPFAAQRFCTAEGIRDAVAVIIMDRDRRIVYEELVGEIANEPNYKAALEALKSLH